MLYYLLPEINITINKFKINLINLDNDNNDIFISKSFCKYLKQLKLMINKNNSNWDSMKKYTNPYEFIHSNLPHLNYSIAKYKPISRAFFKLLEIYKHFDILTMSYPIKTFHLAEGPGGFIEATAFLRKNPNDKYYGITLIEDNNEKIPGWSKTSQFLENNKNVIIEKGVTGNGDLYNDNNYEYLLSKHRNSMEIITGDGGFDFSGDFNKQENNAFRLIFTQVVYAIGLQRYNGFFILKIYDVFLKNTCQIIYLLSCFYKKVYITKPNTSRYANSEKYIICKYFKYTDTREVCNRFKDILYIMKDINYNNYELTSIFQNKIPYYYISKLNEINGIFINQQVDNIMNTIKLISYGDKRRDKLDIIKNQNIIKCIQWCEQHGLDHHKNYNPVNIFMNPNKNGK